MTATAKQIINFSNAKAIRKIRELKKISREELASRLNLSYKAIEKYENGRTILDVGKVKTVLAALETTKKDFMKVKRGRKFSVNKKVKRVLSNRNRRSYKRIITKECRVLKSLRKLKGLSQDEASAICSYSRPTIGHIENGRIELSKERIECILKAYGQSMEYFNDLLKEEILRDEMLEKCIKKFQTMKDDKLKIVFNLVQSM